jgi:P-type Ca2+ transporter type 2B
MTEDFKNKVLQKVIKPFARQSLRTILLAYKDMNVRKDISSFENFSEDSLENDLIFIAIAGIKDPLRDEIPEAIKKCKTSGITVRMVTGDNKDTAVAIAKDAGILPKDYEENPESFDVMEGKDFRKYVKLLLLNLYYFL